MRNRRYYTFAPAFEVASMLLLACVTQGLADNTKKPAPAPAPAAKPAVAAPRTAAPAPAARPTAPAAGPAARPTAPAGGPAARPTAPAVAPGGPGARPTAPVAAPGGPGARPAAPASGTNPAGIRPGGFGPAPTNVRPGTPTQPPTGGQQFGRGAPPAVARPLPGGGTAHYSPADRRKFGALMDLTSSRSAACAARRWYDQMETGSSLMAAEVTFLTGSVTADRVSSAARIT
jgi:hypothetical protein